MKTFYMTTFLILIFINSIYNKDSNRPRGVVQNGDLTCLGNVRADSLTVALNKDFYASDAEMTTVVANEILVTRLNTNALMTSIIIANNKMNTLFINSFLKVKGQIRYENDNPNKTSFIQLSHQNLYVNDVKQWKLIKEVELEDVNKELNLFINQNLISKISEISGSKKEFTFIKTIPIDKQFSHLLIEANFKFLNEIWNNNSAYIKLNGDLYWLDQHSWESEECDMEKWNNQIRIIVPYKFAGVKNNSIDVTFGIKLHQTFNQTMKVNQCPNLLEILNLNRVIEFDNFHISLK